MTDKRTEYRPSDDFDLEFEVLEASAKNRAQREMRIVIMITPIVAVAASGAAVYGIPTLFSALAGLVVLTLATLVVIVRGHLFIGKMGKIISAREAERLAGRPAKPELPR